MNSLGDRLAAARQSLALATAALCCDCDQIYLNTCGYCPCCGSRATLVLAPLLNKRTSGEADVGIPKTEGPASAGEALCKASGLDGGWRISYPGVDRKSVGEMQEGVLQEVQEPLRDLPDIRAAS